jgi:hypothetical protein
VKAPTAYHIIGLTAGILLAIIVVGILVEVFNNLRRKGRKRK